MQTTVIDPLLKPIYDAYERRHREPAIQQGLAYYVEPQATRELNSDTRTELLPQLHEFITDKNVRLLLLLGDSGSGKSLSLHQLEKEWWQKCQRGESALVPLLIELKSLHAITTPDLVAEFLRQECAYSPEKILQVKKYSFLFIFDGYDELSGAHQNKSLYPLVMQQKWQGKLIVSCRTQHLSTQQMYDYVMQTTANVFNDKARWYLASFKPEEIARYVKKYLAHRGAVTQEDVTHNWTQQMYVDYYQSVPGLMDLIRSPLLLKIVTEAVPNLLTLHPGTTPIKRYEVYQAFIQQWFVREILRLPNISAMSVQEQVKWQDEFARFARRLAFEMFIRQTLEVHYTSSDPDVPHIISPWEPFFGETNDSHLLQARAACPLRRSGDHRYSFIHKSFMEYFAAEHVYKTTGLNADEATFKALLPTVSQLPLGKGLLNSEPAIIDFLAERIHTEAEQQRWMQIVRHSRKVNSKTGVKPMSDAGIQTWKANQNAIKMAAANAMTILNAAQFSFSQQDLSEVRIKGANLSQGVFYQTTFNRANLKAVQVQQSMLRGMQASGAKLAGVQFGERAYWQMESRVNCLAFNAEGTLLAAGLADNTIQLRRWPTGKTLLVLRGHTKGVTCLAWQGTQLASGSYDSTIRLWESTTGVRQRLLQGHTDGVTCLAWQGTQLASGSDDNTIRLWESTTGVRQRVLQGHTDGVTCLAWQGSQLASGSDDNTIRLWESTTGVSQRVLQGHTKSVTCLAWQGTQLASGSYDETIRLWESTTGESQRVLQGHTKSVMCLAWQGSQLASGSYDETIRLWESTTGESQRVLQGHTEEVTCLAWQGTQLASGSDDKTIRLWESTTGERQRVLQGHTGWVTCLAWQGTQLASGSRDETIRLWESTTGERQRALQGHTEEVRCLTWQGTQLASGSRDTMVRLWESTTGECLRVLEGHTNVVMCLAWQGTQLASGSWDKTIRLWESTTGECLRVLQGHMGIVTCLASQGTQLASGYNNSMIWLFDSTTGKRQRTLHGHRGSVTCLAWQDSQLASGSADQTIRLWNSTTGIYSKCVLAGHEASLVHVLFISHGAYLLSWSQDGEVVLWQTANGQLLERRQLLPLTAVAVNLPDLVTADDLGRVHFWQATGENLLYHIPPRLPVWQLRHMSGARPLDVTDMNMAGAIGLSEANKRLLKQRGAVGTPAILPPQQQSISAPPALPIPPAALHLNTGGIVMPAIDPRLVDDIVQETQNSLLSLLLIKSSSAKAALNRVLEEARQQLVHLNQLNSQLPPANASNLLKPRVEDLLDRLQFEKADIEAGKSPYHEFHQDRQDAANLLQPVLVSLSKLFPPPPLSPRSQQAIEQQRVQQQGVLREQEIWHSRFMSLLQPFFEGLTTLGHQPGAYKLSQVFISYAWPSDSKQYESWTQAFLVTLAQDLNAAGIRALIDREESRNGRNTAEFMKQEIARSQYVLSIGTESLLEKKDIGLSAVCNELILINDKRREAAKNPGFAPERYPPVLPILLSGSYETSFPAYFRTYMAIESFQEKSYWNSLKALILHFYQAPSQSPLAQRFQEFEAKLLPDAHVLVKGLPKEEVLLLVAQKKTLGLP